MKKNIVFCILGILGIILTLFLHWEPGGESWGYWFFARVFTESGRFIIPDRSPIYTLYLCLFRWLGYPLSLVFEYFVSTVIVAVSVILLFRKRLGFGLTMFSILLWVPFLHVSEPPVQKLALACSCFGIVARQKRDDVFRLSLSYTLFIMAYMFRNTYIVFIVIFAFKDIISLLKKVNFLALPQRLMPKTENWPLFVVVGMFSIFTLLQSGHPWNNGWFSTTRWFPSRGKTMLDSGGIQAINWGLIRDRFGTFEGKDFYFTNQEYFKGADNYKDLVRANPKLFIRHILRNSKDILPLIASPIDFCRLYLQVPLKSGAFKAVRFLLISLMAVILLYGALRSADTPDMVIFILANTALIASTAFSLPNIRYAVPLIPVFILSAVWYGKRLKGRLKNKLSRFAIPLLLVLFSSGTSYWVFNLIPAFVGDLQSKNLRILENRPHSIKSAFSEIAPLVQNCRGIMSLENLFVGSFMNVALSSVYDVWEIPPFGNLDSFEYRGLVPERIDCLLISEDLAIGVGCATNFKIRYENFIKPYSHRLLAMGARTYKIENYGEVIVLPKDKKTKN